MSAEEYEQLREAFSRLTPYKAKANLLTRDLTPIYAERAFLLLLFIVYCIRTVGAQGPYGAF